MAQNLQIDPVKRDYVIENGSPVPSDRVLEAAYFALTLPQDNFVYAEPGQGSLLYKLEGTKHDSDTEQTFASYSKDALKRQLIDTGKATALSVKNTDSAGGITANDIKILPANVQLSDQLEFVSV